LGGYKHAREEEIINQLRIGYILNAASECTNRFPEKVPDFSVYPIKCNFLFFFFCLQGLVFPPSASIIVAGQVFKSRTEY
jgi:hypothetical protein